MLTMDVFKQDAFSATSLTAWTDKLGFQPNFLGSIPGLFDPTPVRTQAIWVESRGSEVALIQTTPRGAPIAQKGGDLREATAFKTRRIAEASRITASELFEIRAFASETELKQLEGEVFRRQLLLRRDMETTFENLRLGAVQGLVTDADASTIVNWESALGQTIPAEVDFDLDAASPGSGVVRTKCNVAVRSILRGLKGLGGTGVSIWGICGDNFWDNLTAHKEVRETYQNTIQAADLRKGNAFESFRYGGINWVNYRGTDDDSTVTVGTDKAKLFPAGAGIFKWAMSPGETFGDLGNVGRPLYSNMVLDTARNEWADVELKAYVLPVCTMPQALYRARRT